MGLEQFIVDAITHPPAPYVPPGFPTNVMPTTFAHSLSAKHIAGPRRVHRDAPPSRLAASSAARAQVPSRSREKWPSG